MPDEIWLSDDLPDEPKDPDEGRPMLIDPEIGPEIGPERFGPERLPEMERPVDTGPERLRSLTGPDFPEGAPERGWEIGLDTGPDCLSGGAVGGCSCLNSELRS